jgi:hypothetical protein
MQRSEPAGDQFTPRTLHCGGGVPGNDYAVDRRKDSDEDTGRFARAAPPATTTRDGQALTVAEAAGFP